MKLCLHENWHSRIRLRAHTSTSNRVHRFRNVTVQLDNPLSGVLRERAGCVWPMTAEMRDWIEPLPFAFQPHVVMQPNTRYCAITQLSIPPPFYLFLTSFLFSSSLPSPLRPCRPACTTLTNIRRMVTAYRATDTGKQYVVGYTDMSCQTSLHPPTRVYCMEHIYASPAQRETRSLLRHPPFIITRIVLIVAKDLMILAPPPS